MEKGPGSSNCAKNPALLFVRVDVAAAETLEVTKVPATLFYHSEPSLGFVGFFSQTHEHIDDSGIFARSRVEE